MSRIGIAPRPAAEMRSGRTALCALCNQLAAASAASSGKGRKMGNASLDLVPEASPTHAIISLRLNVVSSRLIL